MKPYRRHHFLALAHLLALSLAGPISAADLYWDGGTTNIATDGNGTSTAATGTWDTTLTNWDAGASPHVAWNNANLDTANFGGVGTTAVNVALGSDVIVDQIKILRTQYNIGQSGSGTLAFGGIYSGTRPAIDCTTANSSATITAKITGTINGGLVISHNGDTAIVGTGGRVYLTANTSKTNDFVGDITVISGQLHILSDLGDPSNKLILKGGALLGNTGDPVTYNLPRNIEVSAASGIGFHSNNGSSVMNLTGNISGVANLTNRVSGNGTKVVNLQGDMSAYTGVFENTGFISIQSTATSGGSWKLSGGTATLAAANSDAIANGTGKSDLIINGGSLNLNGKAETINGLAGTGGFVENPLASTEGTLTLGDGDSSASFTGIVRDNGGSGGTVAVIKIGAGIQALLGKNAYTGATTVSAGQLIVSNTAGLTPVTVADAATFGVKSGVTEGSLTIPSLATGAGSTVQLDTASFGTTLSPVIEAATFTPGTNTLLKLKGINFTPGTLPLIKYTTLAGTGFAGLTKQLPYRVIGTLVDNTANPEGKRIELNITSAETAVWNGAVGGVANGNWDIDPDATGTAGTMNWRTSVSSTATRYAQGPVNTDQVTFDDSLEVNGTPVVNLTTTLTPRHVRVNNTTAQTYTFTGPGRLSGETALEKDSEGTLIIANTAVNDYTGGTVIANGILQLGNGTTPDAGRLTGLIVNGGNLVFHYPEAVTVTNVISSGTSSAGVVTKLGANTLTLAAANSYGGGTVISSGTVAATVATALGSGIITLGAATTGADPVELILHNRIDLTNSIEVSANGTGTATLAAGNTGTGTTNPAVLAGQVTLDRATTFRNEIPGDRLVFTGKITSTPPEPPATELAPVALTITGGQNVSLQSTQSDFNGSITVTGAGTTLQASSSTAAEVIPDAVGVHLAADTFLKLAATANNRETIAGLTGTGTVQRAVTGLQTLAVGSGNVSSSFDGVIANGPGVVGLTKVGEGTLTLTNTNTYTDTTRVEAGTLLVNGSVNSMVMVTGGTLGGTGSVKDVAVSGSGKISPATATTTGTLTTNGDVSFAVGTEYTAQLNSNGSPTSDTLAVTGTLALGAEVATLAFSDLGSAILSSPVKLVLATATTAITGTFTGLPNNSSVVIGANTYQLKYDDTVGALKAVTLTFGTPAGYAAWASTNGVGAADADFDNDTVENGVEYVLGSDPKVATTGGLSSATTATEFKFTFTRSDASETSDTTVWIETSNDLITWTADGSPHAVGSTGNGAVAIIENPNAPGADPGTDTVTLTVPRNTPAKFARLKMTVAP